LILGSSAADTRHKSSTIGYAHTRSGQARFFQSTGAAKSEKRKASGASFFANQQHWWSVLLAWLIALCASYRAYYSQETDKINEEKYVL